MKKKYIRPNQCLFCTSTACYEHIYRNEEPKYNEIACRRHVDDLYQHVDETLGVGNGVSRICSFGTGRKDRRTAVRDEERLKTELAKIESSKALQDNKSGV